MDRIVDKLSAGCLVVFQVKVIILFLLEKFLSDFNFSLFPTGHSLTAQSISGVGNERTNNGKSSAVLYFPVKYML